jgi:hypothetical protein
MGIAWINQNREWLFDGIGALVTMAVLGWVLHWGQRKLTRHSSNGFLDLDLTLRRLNKMPAVHRQHVWQKSYSEAPVRARGRLLQSEWVTGDLIHVELRCLYGVRAHFRVSRLQYPRLADAQINSRIFVVGKLGQSYPMIELTDVTAVDIAQPWWRWLGQLL